VVNLGLIVFVEVLQQENEFKYGSTFSNPPLLGL